MKLRMLDEEFGGLIIVDMALVVHQVNIFDWPSSERNESEPSTPGSNPLLHVFLP